MNQPCPRCRGTWVFDGESELRFPGDSARGVRRWRHYRCSRCFKRTAVGGGSERLSSRLPEGTTMKNEPETTHCKSLVDRAAALGVPPGWWNTPNPAFGGRTPEDATTEELERMLHLLESGEPSN